MAIRPVFLEYGDEVIEIPINFKWYGGFSTMQKIRCIESLHEAFIREYGVEDILEVSSASNTEDGKKYSAYYRLVGKTQVERIYQGSKVFEDGRQFPEIITSYYIGNPKQYLRDRNTGRVKGFNYNGMYTDVSNIVEFYNWIYALSVKGKPEAIETLSKYSAFTDYFYNPENGVNCQARSCALINILVRKGVFDEVTSDFNLFVEYTKGMYTKI